MRPRVRAARISDAEAMRGIYNEAVANSTATMDTDPRTPQQQALWMEAHNGDPYPALVCTDADARPTDPVVLGWGSLSPYNPRPGYRTTAEVSVYVHAEFRGQGVGDALLHGLIEAARDGNFCVLLSLVTAGNVASERLHARHGFSKVGTLWHVARKFNAWIDVEIYEKRLDAH